MSDAHDHEVPAKSEAMGPPARPRWVKVLLAVLVVVALALLAMVVLGGGQHGPGRHLGVPVQTRILDVVAA